MHQSAPLDSHQTDRYHSIIAAARVDPQSSHPRSRKQQLGATARQKNQQVQAISHSPKRVWSKQLAHTQQCRHGYTDMATFRL